MYTRAHISQQRLQSLSANDAFYDKPPSLPTKSGWFGEAKSTRESKRKGQVQRTAGNSNARVCFHRRRLYDAFHAAGTTHQALFDHFLAQKFLH